MSKAKGCVVCAFHRCGVSECGRGNTETYDRWWKENKNRKMLDSINDPECYENRSTPSEILQFIKLSNKLKAQGYKLSEIIKI